MPLDRVEEARIAVEQDSGALQTDDSRTQASASLTGARSSPHAIRFGAGELRIALTHGPMMGVALHVFLFSLRLVFGHYFVLDGATYFVLGDDQMISMRYARNLVEGAGLCWNVGDCVEGYTNLLWTLWMSIPHLLGIPANLTSLPIILSAGAAGVVAVIATFHVARQLHSTSTFPCVAAVLAGSATQMIMCGAAGFETSLLALCAIGTLLAIARDRTMTAAVALSIGVLTRDDFLPFVCCAALTEVLGGAGHLRLRLLRAAKVCSLPLLAHATHLGFRLSYYGDWLPNTYHLKVEGWSLAERLQRGLAYDVRALPSIAPALLGLALTPPGPRGAPRRVWYGLLFACLAYPSYALWVGGDAFPGTRLLAPAWPALAIGTALLLRHMQSRITAMPVRMVTVGAVVAIFLCSTLGDRLASKLFGYGPPIARALRWLGACDHGLLARHCSQAGGGMLGRDYQLRQLEPGTESGVRNVASCFVIRANARERQLQAPAVATYYAGIPPYFCSEFRAIDLLGKSDRRIAAQPMHPGVVGHNKWDYEHSLGTLKPDYLVSLLPSAAAMHDASYRNAPDGEYNFHRLLGSPTFWRRCAGGVLDFSGGVLFRCTD